MPEPEVKPGKVVDLMAALQESVAKAKASRGEDAGAHEALKEKVATKKVATKKTAAKRTTKKAAGKKKTAPGRRRGAYGACRNSIRARRPVTRTPLRCPRASNLTDLGRRPPGLGSTP
ncbi:hypothetical protein K4749_04335 [Streptomyces sp. TRM72054]|uniref:hypothetical protein n=1 Tax=Streptomyces sp. TRM72054 TaxID=2870562 RepID=UPI001C8C0FDB|nr:hypothetical protein [Streptomyces sp. TRM72054]MBX9392834.1 hypothetical protein [Streptomyces sp. TRM72054]